MNINFDDYQIKMELLIPDIFPPDIKEVRISSQKKIFETIKKLQSSDKENDRPHHDLNTIQKGKVAEIKANLPNSQEVANPPKAIDYAKKHDTLLRTCEELYETEQRYTEVLRIINNILLDVQNSDLTYSGQIQKLLKDIPSMYKLHELISEKFSVLKNEEALQEFPSIFLDNTIIAYLRMYKDFLVKYVDNSNDLNDIFMANKDFQIICKRNTDSSKYENQKMQNLPGMYLQIQSRLSRYKLLLDTIIKNTPPENPNKKKAQDARDNFMELLRSVETEIIRDKATKEAKAISLKLEGRKNQCQHFTSFIKSGPAKKIPRRSIERKSLDRHLFLFSDYLVITEPVNLTNGSYPVKVEITLVNAEIMPINEVDDIPFDHCFRIKSVESSLEIAFQNEDDMNDWWESIESAIIAERQRKESYNVKVIGSRDENKAATWIKDEQSTMCASCYSVFTPIRRRHHCRACGQIFCKSCSSFNMDLKNIGNNVRVCGICYFSLNPDKKPSSAKWMERLSRVTDIKDDESKKPVKTGYLRLAKFVKGQWSCKHLLGLPQEKMHETINHKLCESGENGTLVSYFGGPVKHTELMNLSRSYCVLHPDTAMELYAGSADSKPKDKLVLLGIRIFYLVEKKSTLVIKDQRRGSEGTLAHEMNVRHNSKYRSTKVSADSDPVKLNKSSLSVDLHASNDSSHVYIESDSVYGPAISKSDSPLEEESSKVPRSLKPFLVPVSKQILSALKNNHGFIVLPGNSETFCHYFEANSESLRDQWIQCIRQTVLKC